jgi:hypothetical protein
VQTFRDGVEIVVEHSFIAHPISLVVNDISVLFAAGRLATKVR